MAQALPLVARLAAVLAVLLAAGCGSPEAASSARIQKVRAQVRGIT